MRAPINAVVFTLAACIAAVALPMPRQAAGQEARVQLELVMEPGFPTDQARRWIQTLDKAGITGVRIRGGNVGDRVQVEPLGTPQSPSYKVTGILTLDEKLLLPGGKFTANDVGGISRWLAKLKEGGEEGLTAKTGAFGLTAEQLLATHEGLSGKVGFATKGMPPRQLVEKLTGALTLKLSVDPSAIRALEACDPVADELQGLSQGTALAAAIRPAGLALVPVKEGGQVQLRITDSRRTKEAWPVGWPLSVKSSPRDAAPELFKFIPVEINDTPLGEALTAIGGRVKVPLVFDYVALARQRVDLNETKVNYPKGKTYYGKILDKLLFQAKLKYELRLDEANQPFLWITEVAGR